MSTKNYKELSPQELAAWAREKEKRDAATYREVRDVSHDLYVKCVEMATGVGLSHHLELETVADIERAVMAAAAMALRVGGTNLRGPRE